MSRPVLCSLALIAVAALTSLALNAAPAPIYKPPRPTQVKLAQESLLGDWHNPKNPSVVVNITPTEFAYVNSGQRNNVYNLTLDVTRSPMWYDIRRGGANFVGIWKLEGDTLTLLYNSEQPGVPGAGRPTSFEGAGHREIYYRMTPKKK